MAEAAKILAVLGVIIYTGANGGSGMEAPAKGAKEANGDCIGYSFLGLPGNQFLTECFDCETFLKQTADHSPELQYGVRLGKLLKADGFVIGAEGGPGTLVELMALINLNFKMWPKTIKTTKPIAILCPPGAKGCWGEPMLNILREGGFLPLEVDSLIRVVSTPEAAAGWVTRT